MAEPSAKVSARVRLRSVELALARTVRPSTMIWELAAPGPDCTIRVSLAWMYCRWPVKTGSAVVSRARFRVSMLLATAQDG